MEESKQNKLIIKQLSSKNTEEVLFAINKLRNTGNKTLVPYLIDLLATHSSSKVKESITSLLYDVKYQTAAEEIIKAIKSEEYSGIREELLIVCWQSSLDFSSYIETLTDCFIRGDFKVAFEAFTVIDSIEKKINAEFAEKSINALKSKANTIDDSKKELLIELVNVFENKEKL